MFTTQGYVQEKESFGGVERSLRLRNTKKKLRERLREWLGTLEVFLGVTAAILKKRKEIYFFTYRITRESDEKIKLVESLRAFLEPHCETIKNCLYKLST